MTVNDIQSFTDRCTGCHACVQSCKLKAINMEYSEDGFLYPSINKETCIDCGACYRICPLNEEKETIHYMKSYSGYSIDQNVVSSSSSGGVFYYLAQQVINDGGVVFGAIFDPLTKEVRHTSTDQVSLDKLMRSKYVQSRIGNTYVEVLNALNSGRRVLFVGTPCQMRGLKKYLGAHAFSENLETVDFICHGVPSVTFFKEFLHSLEKKYGSPIKDVTFREKDKGWRTQVIKVYFENSKVWKKESNYYYFYFLENYTLRNSCYKCEEYRSHTSDLTLADDWISDSTKNENGTSLIFVNTNKGQDILNSISKFLTLQMAGVKDISVYSHDKDRYDIERKKEWLDAWKTKGFKYVTGDFYNKKSSKIFRHRRILRIKGKIKKSILMSIGRK